MAKYDYLIVGAGLWGATFAHQARLRGKRCLVVERRDHRGGNVYCEDMDGIQVQVYGPHVFHTSDRAIWDYVNALVPFNHFIHTPIACYRGRLYSLPFNMMTFYQLWGTKTPAEAAAKLEQQRAEMAGREPQNLEEQAIALVGRDLYEALIKGYTEKQWGRDCRDLPASIIKRLPVRMTFDGSYFNDIYQGIPIGGYNILIDNMLGDIEVRLGVDYFDHREELDALADKVIFTGMIDQYYDYRFGELEYRNLRFEHERLEIPNYQGVAKVNYTDREVPYTRIIEHKHFEFGTQPYTIITRQYPADFRPGEDAYYPINDARNEALYERYKALADEERNVIFGGRLALYKYYDMDRIIASALETAHEELR